MTVTFTYWHESDLEILDSFLGEWRANFPNLRIIGDSEIETLLGAVLPEWTDLYRRIQIPTAKSDIARLIYLYEFGGLYVDCHCGLRDPDGLKSIFSRLDQFEIVLWENSYTQYPRSKEVMRPIAGILLARPRSRIVSSLLLRCMANLATQAEREARLGYVEYSSWYLCGAGCYMDVLNVFGSNNTRLRPEFEGQVFFSSVDEGPVALYRHNAYRSDPSRHWSVRQKTELLFEPALPTCGNSPASALESKTSIRVVMTLLVRNEADIVREVIDYHIRRGIDHLIITDNGSDDGTVEIIEQYQKAGLVCLIHEPGDNLAQAEWVTRMALIARDKFGADWIVNSDADEFWYHPSGSLKTICANRNETLLRLHRQNMLPQLEGENVERASPLSSMTIAVVTPQFESLPKNIDHYMLMKLGPKVICRAANLQSVAQGNHDANYGHEKTVSTVNDARIYHYPVRSYPQFERKVIQGGAALARNSTLSINSGYHWRIWYDLYRRGELKTYYDRMVLSAEIRRALAGQGVLQEDRTVALARRRSP